MIVQAYIDQLTPVLKQILNDELKAGNVISETQKGGFFGVSPNHIFIFLKYSFKTPVKNNLQGIKFHYINDRHYWKSEYCDQEHEQTIACNFN